MWKEYGSIQNKILLFGVTLEYRRCKLLLDVVHRSAIRGVPRIAVPLYF